MMDQMKLNARVTLATLDLVRPFEPLRLAAELQADGRWLIGYGHARFARAGAVISVADADALLRYDLSEVADALDTLIQTPLEAHQFEALNAFALHIGLDNFRRSTVLRSVNAGAFEPAAAAMDLWRGAGASPRHPTPDHVAQRRAAERAHFLGRAIGPTDPPPAPQPAPPPAPKSPMAEPAIVKPAMVAPAVSEPVSVEPPVGPPVETPVETPVGPAVGASAEAPASPPRWTPPPRVSRYLREAAPRRSEPATTDAPPPADPDPAPSDAATPSVAIVEAPPRAPAVVDAPVERAPDPTAAVTPAEAAVDPPVRTPPPPQVASPPPGVGTAQIADRTPPAHRGVTVELPQPAAEPAPPSRRSTRLTYALVGLLGVMLFSGALVSMFRQANLSNLVAGLVGVAFMAPAAGHFLFATLSGEGARSATPSA